jgi:hypothetical protein
MSTACDPKSVPICLTCRTRTPDAKFDYFVNDGGSACSADDLSSRYEEVSRLVRFLGALAQAAPLAATVSEKIGTTPGDWVGDLSWLGEELTAETERRMELLLEAGRLWQQRAEQNSAKEEG